MFYIYKLLGIGEEYRKATILSKDQRWGIDFLLGWFLNLLKMFYGKILYKEAGMRYIWGSVGQDVDIMIQNCLTELQPRICGWLLASIDGKTTGIVPQNYIKIMGRRPGSKTTLSTPHQAITLPGNTPSRTRSDVVFPASGATYGNRNDTNDVAVPSLETKNTESEFEKEFGPSWSLLCLDEWTLTSVILRFITLLFFTVLGCKLCFYFHLTNFSAAADVWRFSNTYI